MHILFVCTGNTCRSPLAEAMLRRMAQQEGIKVEVRSAGIYAADGGPISSHSAAILAEQGITDKLLSSSVNQNLIGWADLILTMTGGHKSTVVQRFPESIEKIHTLKEYVEDDAEIVSAILERERLITDLQVKQALAQRVTPEEKSRIQLLEDLMPDYDISDPFGGPIQFYRRTAVEIEESLRKLIVKLKDGSNQGGK